MAKPGARAPFAGPYGPHITRNQQTSGIILKIIKFATTLFELSFIFVML